MRALVAGLALLAVMPTAPAAAATRGTLTVISSGHAARVVTLARSVTLDLSRVQVSGGGALSGFFLIPEAPAWRAATGAAFWREGSAMSVWRTSRTTMPAGRYRLHVTARGAVRFTVPAVGLPKTYWRPTGRVAVKDHRAAWTTAQGPLVLGDVTVPLTTSSLVLMRLSYRATTFGEEVRACVGAEGRPPGCTSEEGMYVRNEERSGELDARGSFLVLVHAPAAGSHSARWQITAYGTVTDPSAYALVIG